MPIVFVLIVAIVAGLVAAAGDRMGYRAARRKLRIGKLRPRTVAMLIAILTGIIISLATYAVVLLIWKDFREALLNYDSVVSRKDAAEAATAKAEADLQATRSQLDAAEAERERIQTELKALQEQSKTEQQQLSDTRGQLSNSLIAVDKARRELNNLNSQIAELKKEVKDLEGYKEAEATVRNLLGQAREEFAEGEIVLSRGAVLLYHRIPAGNNDIKGELSRAVNRALVALQRQGLNLSSTAMDSASTYAEGYPLAGDSHGSVVIVSSARNTIAGQDVELSFDALSLGPLLQSGSQVMEIVLNDNTASVSMAGGTTAQIGIPAQFDAASVVAFADELKRTFNAGMTKLGFLSSPNSGTHVIPEGDINSLGAGLIERARPLTIRLVANQDYNVLDGIPTVTVELSP